ncbi:MAG: ankyrin repeat domain-containing protein [Panacagrimonas sp.]
MLHKIALPALALGLVACAATPPVPVTATPEPPAQKVAVAVEEIAPEDRASFFVHNARTGACDKLGADLDAAAVDVNSFDRVDQTALIAALNHGHIDCARILLDRGADVNLPDPAGWTPLIHAVYFGASDELLLLVLDRGARINAQNDRGVTALYLAAGIGREPQVRLLLERGADPRVATKSGYTPLRIAQQKGLADIVKLLETPPSTPATAANTVGS